MSTEFIFWYLIPLLFLVLFIISYNIDKAKLIPGFLLSCTLISFTLLFCLQAYYSDIFITRLIFVLIMLIVVFLITFGAYIFIMFLIWNTRTVLKKESRSLKHCLTLILAAGVLALILAPRLIDISFFPQIMQYFIYSAYGLCVYYLLLLTQYIISTILCNFTRARKDQHYIIVLGCQVKNGKVSPLLARRVDRAIDVYYRQKDEAEPPKILLSGGKGQNETCAEAEAMRVYALEKGVPDEHLLLEIKSVSTMENMKFSKEIMDEDSNGKPYRAIYVTSNFHLLRAGIFAKKAGLKIDGIGAKTAFYYLPNAILREYIAYLYIHLKWNVALGVVSLILGSVLLYNLAERFT